MPCRSRRLTWSCPGSRQNHYKNHYSGPMEQMRKTPPRIRQTEAQILGVLGLYEHARHIVHDKGIYRK